MKATYLLAVAFLEIVRFSSNGGILNGGTGLTASRSAFSCVFEYLKTPNLMPAVFQCLNAIVQRAFEAAESWLVCISLRHETFRIFFLLFYFSQVMFFFIIFFIFYYLFFIFYFLLCMFVHKIVS